MKQKYLFTGFLVLMTWVLINSCNKDLTDNPYYEPGEENAGGNNTIELETSNTFDTPSPALTAAELQMHKDGLVFFEGKFVTNPAPVQGGLGPLFNQSSCEGCHAKNGRAGFPVFQNDLGGLLLRISINGSGPHGEPVNVPYFGTQLQNKAIIGVLPEAQVNWTMESHDEMFADGEVLALQKPVFSLNNPYTPLSENTLISPRVAPPVFGLGLLDAISESTILSNADENDLNHDGISGKANYVWDDLNAKTAIGKFGWKASQPNLYQQSAKAFNEDMGLTSTLYNIESSNGQIQSDAYPDDPELSTQDLELTTFYTQSLGAPRRRNASNATVLKGKQIFIEAKCASCHIPKLVTGITVDNPFNNNQTIFPYTDLLLHDMGTALADNRPDYLANGQEWRTAPLWGIGLTEIVNGHTNFLHDGRARNIMEAILWHGGEAESSKNYVKKLSKTDRNALEYFLKSL
ncbi:MAG TPA: di-heme oxidoredictase family protein [Saprospiraceae bacterium]|nr:di-heme oxidoredictase family protein [Saprospiraceae bacterium]